MKTVKLFWWRPPSYSNWNPKKYFTDHQKRYKDIQVNFGDELSEFIVNKTLNTSVTKAEAKEQNKLIGIGSVLHFAQDHDTVWGSGINGKKRELNAKGETLNVLGVRGPLTREFLMYKNCQVPEIYGDPALLLKKLYPQEKNTSKPERDYIIVPHFSELENPAFKNYEDKIVKPNQTPEKVIEEILQAKFVISSSLHGIIVAESYGIPSILLKITNEEPMFKYMDYYYGTERFKFQYAKSIEEALTIGGMPPPVFDAEKMIASLQNWHANNNQK